MFQKDGHSFIAAENPDILCMQETKCSVAKLPDEVKKVPGYKTYWLSGDKEGYSGSALFTKKEPIKVTYGISKVYSLVFIVKSLCAHLRCHLSGCVSYINSTVISDDCPFKSAGSQVNTGGTHLLSCIGSCL